MIYIHTRDGTIPSFSSGLCSVVVMSYSRVAVRRERAWDTVSWGEINLHKKYWSQVIGHHLNNKSTAHPLVIKYKYIVFYWCKYVRNDASRYKWQFVSDAQCVNWPSLTFFVNAPSKLGNLHFMKSDLHCIILHLIRSHCIATGVNRTHTHTHTHTLIKKKNLMWTAWELLVDMSLSDEWLMKDLQSSHCIQSCTALHWDQRAKHTPLSLPDP